MTKPTLRISASDLNNYRYYKAHDKHIEQYLAELAQPFRTNYKMQFGTAIHSIIQRDDSVRENSTEYVWMNPRHDPSDPASVPGLQIPRYLADVPRQYFSDIYHEITWEAKAEKPIQVDGHTVNLVVKADGLHGNGAHEIKTTEQIVTDDYTKSLQKLLYLYVFELDWLKFTVIEYNEVQAGYLLDRMNEPDFNPVGAPRLVSCPDPKQVAMEGEIISASKPVKYLNQIVQFDQYPYEGMEYQIQQELSEFIEFMHIHRIETRYLQK